ncbi:YhgE/Pip domain-containing protein, partial [Enterococcus faecalis]|nr:YhgE/Pip domain-containing protein [Enterococcus faecalis]
VELNGKMPSIKEQASVILTLQEKIPEIQNAGRQIAMIDEDFASVEQTMSEGIQEAKQGLEIIQQVQTALPDIRKLGDQANDLGNVTLDGANKLQEALPSITNSVEVTLKSIQQVATTTTSVVATIRQALDDGQLTPEEKQHINEVVQDFTTNIQRQQQAINDIIAFMKQLQENAGNHDLDGAIAQLSHVNDLLTDFSNRLNQLNALVQAGDISGVQNYLNEIDEMATNISSIVGSVDVNGISNTVSTILNKLTSTIQNAQGQLNKAQQIDFEGLLSSTSQTVTNAISLLEKYQAEMPAIKQEIHDANTMLNGNMETIV